LAERRNLPVKYIARELDARMTDGQRQQDSVRIRTGGAITYAYSGGANGIINDGTAAGLKP